MVSPDKCDTHDDIMKTKIRKIISAGPYCSYVRLDCGPGIMRPEIAAEAMDGRPQYRRMLLRRTTMECSISVQVELPLLFVLQESCAWGDRAKRTITSNKNPDYCRVKEAIALRTLRHLSADPRRSQCMRATEIVANAISSGIALLKMTPVRNRGAE